jgi:hypothetical protein
MEERKDAGRALSPAEQNRLLDGLKGRRTPPADVDSGAAAHWNAGGRSAFTDGGTNGLDGKTLTVGRAKTSNGTGRIIPFDGELGSIRAGHLAWFVEHFGEPNSDQNVFPWGKPVPSDPARDRYYLGLGPIAEGYRRILPTP